MARHGRKNSLKPNQSAEEVIALRQILRNLNLLPQLAENEQEVATTIYDEPLIAAVKSFQAAHGLKLTVLLVDRRVIG